MTAQSDLDRESLAIGNGCRGGRDGGAGSGSHVRRREDLDAVLRGVGGVLELLLVEGGGVAVVGEPRPANREGQVRNGYLWVGDGMWEIRTLQGLFHWRCSLRLGSSRPRALHLMVEAWLRSDIGAGLC